jgi:hypothetical protein
MGEAYRTHGEFKKCLHFFKAQLRDYLEYVCVDGIVILKRI